MKYIKMFEAFLNEASEFGEFNTKFAETVNTKTVGDIMNHSQSIAKELAAILKDLGFGKGIVAEGKEIKNVEFAKIFKNGKNGYIDLSMDLPNSNSMKGWNGSATPVKLVMGSDSKTITMAQLMSAALEATIGPKGSETPVLANLDALERGTDFGKFVKDAKWDDTYSTLAANDEERSQRLSNVTQKIVGDYTPMALEPELPRK